MLLDLEEFASFLIAHADLIRDIYNAISGGMNAELLKKTIRDAKVTAADAEAKAELGLPVA